MRSLCLLISLLIASLYSRAQTGTLSGRLHDSTEKKFLTNAVIALLAKKDSSLDRFVRSGKEGQFSFTHVAPGEYTLLISYPKFADYTDNLTVSKEPIDLGLIALTHQSKLLQAVLIRSAGSIRIKGDTTEFVADSFKVREGATVEELLKKLPGFQVNSKGEITAQGQRVGKVLVDDEEFFGDDPTMATKNISAKAVERVQVFDTKSDGQQLTGLTSGTDGKTVNIKLKEDQKKGGFGKYSVASNFQKYHDVNLMYNRFVGKKKTSLYATKSNTNAGQLNWEDQQRLGLNDVEFDEISGFMNFSGDSGDEIFSGWNLQGLPDAYTAGGLFVNKFNKDRQTLNTSYRYNRLATRNQEQRLTQNILPDTLFYSAQNNKSKNLNQQHAFNGKYEWKLDSLSSLRLTTALTRKTTEYFNASQSGSLSEERDSVNSGMRQSEGTATKLQTDNSLQYKKAFLKKGRQLIATARFSLLEDEGTGLLDFTNRFFRNGLVDSIASAEQQKRADNQSQTVGGKLTFAEPLSTTLSLIAEYSYNQNNTLSKRETFEKSTTGKYDRYNAEFSNRFDFAARSHSGSLIGRYATRKWQVSAGSGVSGVTLKLLNLDDRTNRRYHFLNFTPQSVVSYTIKPNNTVRFNYRGATVQPNPEQLQPLRNNLDPLNIVLGNPNLNVGFRNSLSLSYNNYRILKQSGIWMSVNYSSTTNAVANITTIDGRGVRTTKPVNVNGNKNWSLWSEWNKGEGEKKLNHTASLEGSGGASNNFINGAANRTIYINIKFGYGLRYEIEEKFSLHAKPKIGYSRSVSSLNKAAVTSFLTYGGEAEARMNLPGGMELQTSWELNWRQRLSAFNANPNITLWNAELRKKVLKNKSATVSFLANDILNNNRGFVRTINSNFITENRFQQVAQYFMLKLEWSYNKMGDNAQ